MLQNKLMTKNAQKLLIIDADVLDADILLKGCKPGYQIIRLDPESEPITQLTNAIHQHAPVQEIALVAHATPGQLHLSGGLINIAQLERHQQQLQVWRKSLSHDAKLCIYACELAAGEEGTNFINLLSDLTGAEVAASSLPIGKTETRWNWNLDRFTKFFEVLIPFGRDSVETYRYTLAPEISIAGATAIENGDLEFVVTLSEASLGEVRIPYRTLEEAGTAVGGNFDFLEKIDTLTIPAGQTSGIILINTNHDNDDEVDESVILELFDPENAVFPNGAGNLRATGVILDNDGSGNDRALFVSQVKMIEGDNGSQQAVFDVQLSEASTNAITLNYATSDGSALAGQDYQAQTGSVTFNPGETLKSVAVPIIGDTIAETNEFFNLVVTPTVAIANGVDGAVGTAIIQDDDTSAAVPEISIAGATAIENGNLEFVVTLSEASLGEVRIPYRTLEEAGTAVGGNFDFLEKIDTLTIPAGQTSGIILINTNHDNDDEVDESVILELFDPENAVFPNGAGNLRATGVILDNDGSGNDRALFVSQVKMIEGDNGSQQAVFDVQLSEASTNAITLNYATSDGSALAGQDYQAQTGSVTFNPGETLKSVAVPIIGDTIAETNEFFNLVVTPTVAIANGVDGAVGTAIIQDDDTSAAVPEISIAGATAIENGNLEFVVTLSEASLGEVRIPYRTLEEAGTAVGGNFDFLEKIDTLTIPAGQTSGIILINTNHDNGDEVDESVILELFDPENAVLPNGAGNLRATGVILDNDGSGNDRALFVSQVKMIEGDNGSQQAVFDVQLSEASTNAITLNYATSDGSALAGQDYQAQTGSVTFNPGETLKSVAVPIIGDTIAETNEFFNLVVTPTVAIANGVDGAVGTAIIQDDDTSAAVPEISIAGATAIENGNLEFVVTLSEASLGEVRIPYRTLEEAGTAVGGNFDFLEKIDTLTIPAGQTSGIILINTNHDNGDEVDESVILELFDPENAVLPDGVDTLQATGIILDNDGTGNNLGLFVGNAQIVEGEDGYTREVAVPIQLSRPSDQKLTFRYQTADDTAIAGSDYAAQTDTVTFLPGETMTAVHIPITGDSLDEPNEAFTLTVTPTPAIANGSDGATGTVTIIDGNVPNPNPVNNPPVAQDDAFATDEDTSVAGNLLADNGSGADSDPDGDTLSVSSTGVIATALGASVTVNADGSFSYDPNGQFESLDDTESTTDTFDYTSSDGNGGTDTATVSITVNGVNDAPVAQADSVSTDEDTILNGNVLSDNGNGADSDVDGDALSVAAENITTAAGALVVLNAVGTFSYDPNGQFEALNDGQSATDSFIYTLSDNDLTDTGTVTITINGITDVPVNNPPVAQDDAFATDEDTSVAGNLLADNGSGADSDPDGDTLSVSSTGVIATALGASVTVNADGSFSYDPNGQFESLDDTESTTDTFDYTLSDGNGGTDTATVSIIVNGVNDAPVAQADSVSTDEDTILNGNVLNDNGNGADSDVDGDTLSVNIENITTAAGALVTLNADGTFSYDPNGQFESLDDTESTTDTFDYTLSDGNGGTDTATVSIIVNGVNDAPVAQADSVSTDEDTILNGNVLNDNGNGADSDVDGDTLSVNIENITTAAGALVTLNADGTFSYDPNGQFEILNDGDSATDSFTYTLSDGDLTDTAIVEVNVKGVGGTEPPVVVTIGDAPLRVSRSDPNAWENAWTDEAVSISHKANYLDKTEAWSSASLNGRNSNVLNGGDIFGGDLGVSGQSLASSSIRQEIDGKEALRFDLDQAASKITIDLSRLDGNSSTGHFDAGRLQLLDDSGSVINELIFSADAASHEKQITLDHSAGFSSVVLTAGSYNGVDFVFGGLTDETGQFLSDPQDLGNDVWNASEYLVDAVEFEFGEITLVGSVA